MKAILFFSLTLVLFLRIAEAHTTNCEPITENVIQKITDEHGGAPITLSYQVTIMNACEKPERKSMICENSLTTQPFINSHYCNTEPINHDNSPVYTTNGFSIHGYNPVAVNGNCGDSYGFHTDKKYHITCKVF